MEPEKSIPKNAELNADFIKKITKIA